MEGVVDRHVRNAACKARTLTPIPAAMSDTVIGASALSRMNCSALRRIRGEESRTSRYSSAL